MLYQGDNNALKRYSLMMILFGASMFVFPLIIEIFPAQFRWHVPAVNLADEQMIVSMYIALGICFITAAKDPVRNAALIDFTIISSILHGAVMFYWALEQEGNMPHMWGDVPMMFILAIAFMIYHPRRVARNSA